MKIKSKKQFPPGVRTDSSLQHCYDPMSVLIHMNFGKMQWRSPCFLDCGFLFTSPQQVITGLPLPLRAVLYLAALDTWPLSGSWLSQALDRAVLLLDERPSSCLVSEIKHADV